MSSSNPSADRQAEPMGATVQARSQLFMLASGFMLTQAIGTVVRLGIPELVSARRHSAAELASAVAADVSVLSAILHDWDDGPASSILRSIHEAMTSTSTLLVADAVITAGNEQDNAKLLDLLMLVALGGRERTEDEWRTLLSRNGFIVVRVDPGLIEAIRN